MILLLLVIVLLLIYYINFRMEPYRSCTGCDGGRLPDNGVTRLNPFLPPFSSTQCVDDLYIIENDTNVKLDSVGPLTHLNTPDHVVLTN